MVGIGQDPGLILTKSQSPGARRAVGEMESKQAINIGHGKCCEEGSIGIPEKVLKPDFGGSGKGSWRRQFLEKQELGGNRGGWDGGEKGCRQTEEQLQRHGAIRAQDFQRTMGGSIRLKYQP